MRHFQDIESQVIERFGSKKALSAQLQKPLSPKTIKAIPDDRWLSEITRAIFQAGFNWKVVDNKWDDFETVFSGFNVDACAFMSEEFLEGLLNDKRIIRNWTKIKTIPQNAYFLRRLIEEHGSLGDYFATWQIENYGANMLHIQSEGARLGGMCGQLFLRRLGVDTVIFTQDVLGAFEREGLPKSAPKSAKAWGKMQDTLLEWHKQSGRGLNEISKILALSVNYK